MTAIEPQVDKRFSRHLLSDDELGAVVRAHIHIEANLRAFVEMKVKSPTHLPRLTYEARLRLAVALGFDEQYLDSLKYLGDIRNAFSHNLEAKLTDASMTQLYSKLPADAQQDVLLHFKSVVADWGEKTPRDFFAMSPKNRFVLMVAILMGTTVGIVQGSSGHVA
jgi:hypothetical protein